MSDDTFLSRDELRALTGRRKKDAQKRVLRARRIRFTEDGDERPVVLRAALERRLLGHAEAAEPGPAPDFSMFPKVS